jgi:hypothetical protein
MFELYKVNAPVLIKSRPSASSTTVNSIDKGKTIEVVSEEDGWLKTISGRYVLNSNRLTKMADVDEEILRQKMVRLNLQAFAGSDQQNNDDKDINLEGTIVKINSDAKKDINGQDIPDSAKTDNSTFKVSSVDPTGYVNIKDSDGKTYRVALGAFSYKNKDGKFKDVDINKVSNELQYRDFMNDIKAFKAGFTSAFNAIDNFITNMNKMTIKNIRTVFGMPYQFMPICDNRIDNTNNDAAFGRKFAQKIVGRAPIMVLQAGVANFLQGYEGDKKAKIQKEIVSAISSNHGEVKESDVNKLVNQSGRYYNFKATPEDYFFAVNQMCRSVASLLNINDVEIEYGANGEKNKLGNFDWGLASQHPFAGYNRGSVSFYINSETQVQESFSNSTTQSQLASKINQVSDMAREVNFLLGGASGLMNTAAIKPEADLEKGSSDTSSMSGILGSMWKHVNTMMAGGKMFFPEIWADSSFMRSYDITIKLDSPDCDVLSLYLNIFVPLCHILGFVMPRSAGDNTYVSPFLIRAFYKSMFHVDMGIITNCSIQRGDLQGWTQDGLPTQVTIQLSIKDLYDVMSMATGKGDNDMIGNPAQLDYLANMCGINIAEPNMLRYVKLYWLTRLGSNTVKDRLVHTWSRALGSIYAAWNNMGGNQSGNGSIM